MSVNSLLLNEPKPWANLRVNTITVDNPGPTPSDFQTIEVANINILPTTTTPGAINVTPGFAYGAKPVTVQSPTRVSPVTVVPSRAFGITTVGWNQATQPTNSFQFTINNPSVKASDFVFISCRNQFPLNLPYTLSFGATAIADGSFDCIVNVITSGNPTTAYTQPGLVLDFLLL